MGNILTPELQKQIIKEANSSAANFHYYPGSEQFEDMWSAYESGAFKYAEKWQEAEQRAVTMAEVIEELMNIAYPNVPVLKKANQVLADYNTHKQSLTPKTSTDEQ